MFEEHNKSLLAQELPQARLKKLGNLYKQIKELKQNFVTVARKMKKREEYFTPKAITFLKLCEFICISRERTTSKLIY